MTWVLLLFVVSNGYTFGVLPGIDTADHCRALAATITGGYDPMLTVRVHATCTLQQ